MRKQKVEKAVSCILNRVKFHAPVVFDSSIDRRILFENGVDLEKPIFKFEKQMTKVLLKAFQIASEEENFNLLVPISSFSRFGRHFFCKKSLKKIKNLLLFNPETCSHAFLEMVNKLNINYSSSSNYDPAFREKFLKIDGKSVQPCFDDFCLTKTGVVGDVYFSYHEFVLNGNNFFVRLQNVKEKEILTEVEFNFPLEKGYYYFKKLPKVVLVENLLKNSKFFFNFHAKNSNFSFSEVEGLENSVFSCINVKAKIKLQAKEETFVFFNVGEEKFSFKGQKEICEFMALSKKKCYEIFDVQVKTKNPDFDVFFNSTLPQKIWLEWANCTPNQILEEKYLSCRKLFVKGKEKINLTNFREIGIREIGIFNGKYYKKILVLQGSERFLRVGRTVFHNITGLTMFSLKSNEPMAVCFGDEQQIST